MISFLRGKIIETGKNCVILDVSGVGYRVKVTSKALNSLAKNGDLINFYAKTVFNQHESEFDIYGFPKKDDLEMFELLTSISGIGPKNALNIMSSIEAGELAAAVSKEDADYLRKVSGLGPKTAKRLVVELKDKMNGFLTASLAVMDLNQESDAIDALVSLGYQKHQAQEALRKVSVKTKGLEARVKEALKTLSSK